MIVLKDVRKAYILEGKPLMALAGVTFSVGAGEVFGVVGHSGAGKSTLMRCLSLLERPTSGQILLDGQDLTHLSPAALREARRRMGVVFQHFNLLSSATVFDNVALPLKLPRVPREAIASRVGNLLELVGLTAQARKYPAQLSGGQKQRVGIARALVHEPALLLCDEATSALDPVATQSILELLARIHRQTGITMVLITHEMSVVRDLCDHVAVMSGGRVVESGDVANVFLAPQHAVTQDFVLADAALAVPDAVRRRYAALSASERARSRVLRVKLQGERALEPRLFSVVQSRPVALNILHGAISSVRATPFAHLLIELRGDVDALADTVERLRAECFEVEAVL
jgi:D-methionine transport system ATP-binding protein